MREGLRPSSKPKAPKNKMASVEDSTSSSEEMAETTLNEDLPRGSERDVIEYYF